MDGILVMSERDVLDIHNIMRGLAEKRPIFHSEADFQFALAWHIKDLHIKEKRSDCEVRLEWPPSKENMRIDIWLPNDATAIELKHPLDKAPEICHDGERFKLGNYRSAQARYGFVKDIRRLERMVDDERNRVERGFAVLLTNRKRLWKTPTSRRKDTRDEKFRIHQGVKLCGTLAWLPESKSSTNEKPICLQGSYELDWQDFSDLKTLDNIQIHGGNKIKFRYLAVEVSK